MSRVKAGEAFVEIGGDPRKLFAALNKVQRQIGKIGNSFASAGKQMMGLGAGITGPIAAAGAAFASMGSALYDMSKRTGVATEALSVLKFAAEQTGTDMAGVETAVKKMQKAIYAAAGGSEEASKALAMVGLEAKDLAGLSADQQMGKIADGLMAIEDPGTRAAVAMQLFGKAGTMILPMLEGGSAGMTAFADEAKRLGLVMDGETAAKADALGDSIDALKSAMKMAFIQVGSAVAPILTDIAKQMAIVAAGVGKFIGNNQQLVVTALKVGAALTAGGAALFVFGKSLSIGSALIGGFGSAVATAFAPLKLLLSITSGIGGAFASAVPGVFKLGYAIGDSMASAAGSVARFAGQSASQLAGFAASGMRSVLQFCGALQGVFASQFRIARFIGQSFGQSLATAFAKTAASIAPVRAAVNGLSGAARASVTAIGPALGFISKGFMALASDVARLAAPLTRPFVSAAGAVATFATSVAGSVTAYISSIATASAATVTNNARIASAWVGSALKAVWTFVGGVAAGVATYVGSIAGAVAASVGAAAGIAGAWLATAFPATAAFVSGAVAKLGVYIASVAASLAASVASAAGIAVAWVSSGMPGLMTFVGSALAGLASYVGSCAVAVASSVASAAAIAAAWLAPAAPILAIGAVLVGAGVAAYKFRDKIGVALGGVGELAGKAGGVIGSTFGKAVANAKILFGDLFAIGKQTFGGIYDAIANGDLAGAMDVLWAGLKAGWLRGIESIVVAWHQGVGEIKKAFVQLGSAWDKYVTKPASMFGVRVAEAGQERQVLGAFDTTQGTVFDNESKKQARGRRSVAETLLGSSTIEDFAKNRSAAESVMANRQAVVDAGSAPGATAEQRKAGEAAAKEVDAMRDAINLVRARFAQLGIKTEEERKAAVDRATAEIDAVTQSRIDATKAATKEAAAGLDKVAGDQADKRAVQAQAGKITDSLASKDTWFGVQKAAEDFWKLAESGKLTEEQMKKFRDAVDQADERIAELEAGPGGATTKPVDPKALEQAAREAAAAQSEVAGTFSAQAIGGMGFGQNLAQKQLDELKNIHAELKKDNEDRVAA